VTELTLAEGAALASIRKFPTKYDPKQNPEYNLERRNTVLKTMYSYGDITKEEFEAAWDEPLKLYTEPKNSQKEEKTTSHVSSDYVDAVIEDLIADIMEKNNVSREIASNLVFSSGYRVYLCMDPKVQSVLEECYLDDKVFPEESYTIVPQSAMVVCDPNTGDCLGIIGRRWEKTQSRIFNLATQARRSPGSSIKPLSTYGPGIDLGIINWGTVVDDSPDQITSDKKPWPQNVNHRYLGLVNVSYAVQQSLNTVAVKVLRRVTVERSYEYLKKLGIYNLVESYTNKNGVTMSDLDIAPLALGATTLGLTVREMASAYTTFTNGGIHNKSRTYTKVLDSQGNVVIDNKLESTVVFSTATCSVMTKLMENVVKPYFSYIKIDDMTVCAGKTGTSMHEYDRWFCGFTPYYVGAVWYGFVEPSPLRTNYRPNPAMSIFDNVMVKLHKEMYDEAKKEGTELIKEFPVIGDIVQVTVCKDSGQLYNPDVCGHDPRGGRAEVGYFINGTQPTTYCTQHVAVKYCTETGKIANEYCQHTTEKVWVLAPERNFSIYVDIEDSGYMFTPNPLKVCTVHNEYTYDPYEEYETEPEETDIPAG
jgi:penicillin-binding protein 1A